ncbi:MAG: MFS transporter [Pseudomonadaceae bacterium]|nr:MFS transporter [Pseudomonadaceae bacterium]
MSTPAVTRWTRLGYATGVLSFTTKDVAFGSFVLFYYVSVVGLSGTLAGVVLFIALAWDALTDPIIGSFSDNLRSRWGRRHPLMAASGIPLAASLYLLFSVPEGLGQMGLFLWMLGVCIALRTFITLFTVPYLALGAELSNDYLERSKIAGARTLFGWLAGILLTAGAWYFVFDTSEGVDGRLITANYHLWGTVSFAVVAIFTTLVLVVTRKRIPFLPQANVGNAFSLKQLAEDLTIAFKNSNFKYLFFVMLTLGVATGLNGALGTHLNTYFWEFTTAQLAVLTLLVVVPIAVMTLMMNWLNERIEKQTVLNICIIGLVINTLWLIPGRLLDWIPSNGTDAIFYIVTAQVGISSALVIWFQTVSASVIADITDEQEYLTHKRQEGVFFAAQGFSIKFVTGFGSLVGGVVIDLIRLPVGAAPGTVEADIIFNLGIVMGPCIALSLLVPYFFSRKITLSRARHSEIRSLLDARGHTPDAPPRQNPDASPEQAPA